MAFQVLRNGSRGPDVKNLQNLLNTRLRPSPNLNPDSIFGNKTKHAVMAFQRDKKLVVIGVVDDRTWEALREGKENKTGLSDYASEVHTKIKVNLPRPSASGLAAEFVKFRIDGRMPCNRVKSDGKRKISNQCAVRMSIALSRSIGDDILVNYRDFFKRKISSDDLPLIHSQDCCAGAEENRYPHITGATHLKDYLKSQGFTFLPVKNGDIIKRHEGDKKNMYRHEKRYKKKWLTLPKKKIADEIALQIGTQKGIIYFRHCFKNGGKIGSHIDYWNGTRYANAAEGSRIDDGKNLFFRAKWITFCRLGG